MATYLQNITDYIPQIAPFRPDLNYFASALQTKQTQYDANYQKLNSVYGSLLNSPMVRDTNIARRDEFFRAADESIKKIAGLDLSLPENVDQAYSVFKPFYDDPYMVKDMTWTKQYQSELNRAENFRNCVDEKKCGGRYWDGGVQALNYKLDEFRNTSDQQSLQATSPRFVPFVNMTEKALAAAKDAGFNVKVDSIKGGYIVTTKNGQALLGDGKHTGLLPAFFTNLFGSDPAIQDVFKTQAYLLRKNTVAAAVSQGMDPMAAEQAYIEEHSSRHAPRQMDIARQVNEKYDSLLFKKTAYESKIREEGVMLGSKEHSDYAQLASELELASKNKEYNTSVVETINSIKNTSNLESLTGRIDDAVAGDMFQRSVDAAANTFAYMDYEVSYKADPFALENQQSRNALRNSLTLQASEFEFWKQKEGITQKSALAKKIAENNGDASLNTGVRIGSIGGSATTGQSTLDINIAKRNKLYNEQFGEERGFLADLANNMINQYQAAKGSTDPDSSTRLNTIMQAAKDIFAPLGLSGESVILGDGIDKIRSMQRNKLTEGYNKAVEVLNPNAPVNGKINKDWSSSFWNETEQIRNDVSKRNTIISSYDSWYKEQSTNTINALKGQIKDPIKNAKEIQALDGLTDSAGRVKTDVEYQDWYYNKFKNDPEVLNEYVNIYDPAVYGGSEAQAGTTPGVSKGPGVIRIKRGSSPEKVREFLYSKAQDEYKDLKSNYREVYRNTEAWNGTFALGNKGQGGGLAAEATQYDINSGVQSGNYLIATDVFRNLTEIQNDPEVKFAFGDASILPEAGGTGGILDRKEAPQGSTQAKNLFMDVINRFYDPGEKNKDAFRFSLQYQDIAANNDQYTAIRLMIPEDIAKKYTGTKDKPGPTYSDAWRDGITAFIPKDRATNKLHANAQLTDDQFLMDHFGKMVINTWKDNGGEITLTKVGENQYDQVGSLKTVNSDGSWGPSIPLPNTINMPVDAKVIYNNANMVLKSQAQYNKQIQDAARLSKGVRNPQELLK